MVVDPFSAFQVLGPTTPSTPIPAADCRLRTAVLVAGPKDPSTAMDAPRSLSLGCRARTAWPRSPWRSLGCEPGDGAEVPPPPPPMVVDPFSAFQVLGPTTPSTPIPAADCRLRTAVLVAGPKDPSTAMDAPRSL